jgi:hypothetical protein
VGDGGTFDAANLTSGASGDGDVLTSDGVGGAAWEAIPAGHAAVTLDGDAAVLLDLTGQEIGLDVQNANTVFRGPTSGAANEPTFGALVAADLPANVIRHEIVFSIEGNLTTGEKPLRIYPPTGNWTIEVVRAAVNTAPLNQAAIFDIHMNGVTIFTDQAKRASIAATAYLDDSDTPDVTVMGGNDYLQLGVDQIGTGTVGADGTIHVIFVAA